VFDESVSVSVSVSASWNASFTACYEYQLMAAPRLPARTLGSAASDDWWH